jgi:16S rRNA processing protein RimM
MAEPEYINIGHTRKTHGVGGELKIMIETRFVEDFLKNERIFIDVKGIKIPYFITSVRGTLDLIVALEDVDNKEAAYSLQSREVFLRKQDLIPEHLRELEVEDESLEYAFLAGFTLIDQTLGEIGVIDEILDMPQQEMAMMKHKGKDVLIPLNKSMILKVDKAGKRLTMDLPDGLLDM